MEIVVCNCENMQIREPHSRLTQTFAVTSSSWSFEVFKLTYLPPTLFLYPLSCWKVQRFRRSTGNQKNSVEKKNKSPQTFPLNWQLAMAISGYLTSFTKTRCIVPCVKRLSFGFIWQVSEFSRLILTLFHDSFICFADLKVARCQLDANRCGEVIEMEMSDDDIDTIVGLHNDLRRKVASGQEDLGSPGPQPTATFMPDLVFMWHI